MRLVRFFIATILLLTTATSIFSSPATDELSAVETNRYDAIVKENWKAIDAFLHDDLIFIHASGRTDTKSSFLERVKNRIIRYTSIEATETNTRVYGNCGVITGKVHLVLVVNGNDIILDLTFTSVYSKIGGKWKLVSYQSTKLPE